MPPSPMHRPPDQTTAGQPSGAAAAAAAWAAPADAPPAESLHAQVLSVVAARICRPEDGAAAQAQPCLEMLCDALTASDDAFDRALGRLRSQHALRDEDLVDCYIPAVACKLGSDWTENRRSFAEVTIATARLIAAVRDLSRRWTADSVADWRAPAIVLVVPEAEQHRLGAMIAATRFRRRGVSVQLLLGRPDQDVLDVVRRGDYQMIGFSLSTVGRVEPTRRVIQMLRDRLDRLPPVVVGGAIRMCSADLKAQLGADHVVSDPDEALRRCGVRVPEPGRPAPRSPT